jgi:hypothetical protein
MPIELDTETRRKILRQHRDLRQVLAATKKVSNGADHGDDQQRQSLVALGLRLGRMMGRHSLFEEAALRPYVDAGGVDSARVEGLASRHRQQLVELTLLTKLAFESGRAGRLLAAFRGLSENILKQINKEDRELFRKQASRRSVPQQNGPHRGAAMPESSEAGVATSRNPASV